MRLERVTEAGGQVVIEDEPVGYVRDLLMAWLLTVLGLPFPAEIRQAEQAALWVERQRGRRAL